MTSREPITTSVAPASRALDAREAVAEANEGGADLAAARDVARAYLALRRRSTVALLASFAALFVSAALKVWAGAPSLVVAVAAPLSLVVIGANMVSTRRRFFRACAARGVPRAAAARLFTRLELLVPARPSLAVRDDDVEAVARAIVVPAGS